MASEQEARDQFERFLDALRQNLLAYQPLKLIPPGYHPDFAEVQLLEAAGWECQHCHQPFFSVAFGKRGIPYLRYPQRAHEYSSRPEDPQPKILVLCCACHLAYDNKRPGGRSSKSKAKEG